MSTQPSATAKTERLLNLVICLLYTRKPLSKAKIRDAVPQYGLTDLHRIVLVGDDTLEFGVLADMGVAVRQVSSKGLQPAPTTLAAAGAQYLKGVTADRLTVLDMERILGDPRLLVNEEPDQIQ